MLNHLTGKSTQIGGISALDHLTGKSFEHQLGGFLLSCKVDELSPDTIKYYSYTLGAFIKFSYELGVHRAQDVTTHHIRLFILSLQETNIPISVHAYYRAVRRFFNWLIAEGLLDKSPMVNIRPPRIAKRKRSCFSDGDINNLLLLTSGNRFLEMRNRAMVLMLLDTGIRLSELANIQIGDIDFNRETIKILGKGNKERIVRVGKRTRKALIVYLLSRDDSHPCLWITEERRPMTRYGVQSTIRVLCRRAGITDAKPGPHTFRHTAAISYLRNGGDIMTLKNMLGHSKLDMVQEYLSGLEDEDMLAVHRKASPVDRLGIK